MKKLEIYNSGKTYMFPNMTLATPEKVMTEYTAVNQFKCIITTDISGEMIYSIDPFNAMKSRLGVNPNLSDEEALEVMEEILNTTIEVTEPEPTAEERIAAALEYQNLLSM